MARHNLVFINGYVETVNVRQTSNGRVFALAHIRVARADRSVGDKREAMWTDSPVIMSRNPDIIREMETWEVFDTVQIKGTLAQIDDMKKTSICPYCKERTSHKGVLVYVNPIFAKKIGDVEDENLGLEYLKENREISNQAYIFGNICREPKKMTPKNNIVLTQYQIAITRKFRIATDPPAKKTDFPWVKSYGENAISDKRYLHTGSKVFIDGCLQTRGVTRTSKCGKCEKEYKWKDRALEIVPYETEYIANFYSPEEAEELEAQRAKQAVKDVLGSLVGYKDEEEFTSSEILAGMITEEED